MALSSDRFAWVSRQAHKDTCGLSDQALHLLTLTLCLALRQAAETVAQFVERDALEGLFPRNGIADDSNLDHRIGVYRRDLHIGSGVIELEDDFLGLFHGNRV